MSITLSPTNLSQVNQNTSALTFDEKLNISKSSQIMVDYMKEKGKSAINADELAALASSSSGDVPAEVSAAAAYMQRHPDVFTAIETHDVAGADGLSGSWNFEWAAEGGLAGTSTEAIANMEESFNRAIEKSAKITELTTESKTELDATKQRAQN